MEVDCNGRCRWSPLGPGNVGGVYIPLLAFFFRTPSFTLYGSLGSLSISLDCRFLANEDNGPVLEGEASEEEAKVKDGVEGEFRRGVAGGLT